MRHLLALTLFALGPAALHADSLADVRGAVAPLNGAAPIHVTVEVQRTRTSSGRFANQHLAGTAALDVSSDANGLHFSIPAAVIQRAVRESREHDADPARLTPTRASLSETDPTDIADALNFRDPLLHLLSVATRVSEVRTTRNGRPARALVLKLTPKLSREATSVWNVKFSQDQLTLWIGDDNLPIFAERVRKGSAGFLFLKGEMGNTDSWTFARVADRLVVVRTEISFAGSGFGQKGEGKSIVTLTVR
jgi:hypothetical protein